MWVKESEKSYYQLSTTLTFESKQTSNFVARSSLVNAIHYLKQQGLGKKENWRQWRD